MEVRGRNGSIELPTPNPSKPEGIVALRHFTIPRKQWMSGQVHLEACTEDSRDYALIQSKLRGSRLDMRKEHANTWLWKDVKLVHNDGLLREFSEKRSEMRANGRHGREMEEHFGFLLASYEATNQIYQFGLRTGSQEQYSLGKPSHGVYLFKHVDVALKHATAGTGSGKNLIVFKVLFGKVKKVTASLEWNKTVDPTVSFDCHMAKDAVSYRDSVSQQVLGSSVFLFDYNQNQELAKRPRQCLPYAVVSFAPAGSAAASISPPASPTKPPAGHMQGTLENLKGCTVAKRTGKGCPSVEYQSQTPGAEPNGVDTTAFQYNDLQTSPLFIPQQAYMPYYDTAEFFSPSLPYYDSGISWQSYGNKSEFPLNLHNWSATGVYGCNTETMELIPQTSAERISTIVYSSRLVKDPRLSRQETNIQTESSEEERASSANCTEEQACQAHSQGRKEENESTLSCEEQSVELDKEHKEERFPDPSLDDASKTNSTAQPKTENMPSIKLFKMKFQKYAPYFKMTEEERHRKIWSKGNLTVEQKQLLIDRIHFYEMHHQKYKQGLLFPKDTEPEPAFSLSHTYSQNNDVCSSTHPLILEKANRCEANQSQRAGVSSLTPTTVLDDSGRNKVDILSTDIDEKLKQRVCRPKENHVQDAEQDCSLDSQTEPQGGGMVQSVREKERMSQTFVGQGNVQSNPSGRSKLSESADIFFAQSICPSLQVNNQDVENEISTCPKEYCACTPTLCNAIEDCSKSEPHITMEVANCVDVSATVLDCNFCPYATAMESGQHSQSSTDKQHREPLTYFKSTSNSEMSIEVEMEKVQQQNTVYNSLYERLQLDQLLSNSNGANDLSNKPYLRPKGLDKMPATDPPDSHVNEPKEEDLQLIVKLKSGQTFPERLMLSERFSNLRHFGRKLAAFIRVHRLTNSYTTGPNGDLKCEPKAQMYCSDGEKGTENNNAMLIKLMAQRYNENLFKANCKRLRQKSTKFRCQKSSSVLSRRTSGLIRFQTQTKHLRKNHLLKAKKKFTNLALKVSSRGLTSFSKSTSDLSNDLCCTGTANHVDKSSESYLSSTSATQSQPGSQVYGELLNEKSGENDHTINISTEEGSRVDSDNQTRHDEELSETKGQYIHLAKQSIESVCRDVLKISNLNEFKESEENITLDPNDLEEMKLDSKTNNSKTRHQEKSSMVSCSDSNESSNGENAGTKPKEAAILTKKLSQRNNSDTKKISPEYNTGAYEDTSSPVYTVSSIPSAITPENLISSSTTTAHTALTPDSPEVMNNRANTPTKSGKLGVNAVDNSASGLPQSSVMAQSGSGFYTFIILLLVATAECKQCDILNSVETVRNSVVTLKCPLTPWHEVIQVTWEVLQGDQEERVASVTCSSSSCTTEANSTKAQQPSCRLRIEEDLQNGFVSLVINPVEITDAVWYRCTVQNGTGSHCSEVKIAVKDEPQLQTLSKECQTLDPFDAVLNETLSLQCPAAGSHPGVSQFFWGTVEDVNIPITRCPSHCAGRTQKPLCERAKTMEDGSLTISPVWSSDSQWFWCLHTGASASCYTFRLLVKDGGDWYRTQNLQEQTNGGDGTVYSTNPTVIITTSTMLVFLFMAVLLGGYCFKQKHMRRNKHQVELENPYEDIKETMNNDVCQYSFPV